MISRMLSRGTILAVLLATLALACATGPELRVPQAHIAARRLAALPTQASVFLVGRGRKVANEEMREAVQGNVDDSINYLVSQHGGRAFGSAATARLDHYSEFYHWSWRAMNEIGVERLGWVPATHHSVTEWRFPRDITSWRAVLNADFVLVSFIEYLKPAKYPDAISLTGVGSRAIACVVALDGGQIIWCNFIPDNSVLMEDRPAAQSAVDVLLGDMLKLAD